VSQRGINENGTKERKLERFSLEARVRFGGGGEKRFLLACYGKGFVDVNEA